MKYLPLIWAGLWRKPGRTVLIFLQVGVAFILLGVLQGLKTGVEQAIAAARADLMIVHSRQSFLADPLPLGLLEQIRSVPGVKLACPVEIFGATYQMPSQRIGVVAIGLEPDWPSAFTYIIAPEYVAALQKNRTGALVKEDVAKKYGWKVGDRVPLLTTTAQHNGSTDWSFDVVGTFTDTDVGGGGNIIVVSYDYVNKARAAGTDTVQHFNVLVSDPKLAVSVAEAIDAKFANSSHETGTDSIRDLAQATVQSIGDWNFLARTIIAAVLMALLFATATMMIQSTRERTGELAILKTVGFSGRAVFFLILAEAVTVCVPAAAVGLALATPLVPRASVFIRTVSMPWIVIVLGLGFAVLVAFVCAAIPASRAARIRVAEALAGR